MNFSIITCTYNPNPLIFKRLIKAISLLEIPNKLNIEWIIIDNNSTEKIENSFDFSPIKIPINHILEKEPGLTNARIAGTKNSNGEWLIFFDDDNEPNKDFLIELQKGIKNFPQVNCWGPGQIHVEYIGKVKKWFEKHPSYYQQRKELTKFGSEQYIQPYYPIGTGLCIQKEAMLDYIQKVEAGQYNVSDRTGRSLVSGGDTQIVLNNQLNGGIAGKLEKLGLTHMIEARKATFKYLKKQKFWTAASYHIVLKQVYTDAFLIQHNRLSFTFKDIIQLTKKFYFEIKVKRKDFRSAYLNTCGYLGEYYAPYIAVQKKPNRLYAYLKNIIIQ